jgi:hypothetical protein
LEAIDDYKEIVMIEHVIFCFVSFDIKGSDRNISTICSLFSDQEQRFAITNHDLACALLL